MRVRVRLSVRLRKEMKKRKRKKLKGKTKEKGKEEGRRGGRTNERMKEGIKASELKSQFSDEITYFFILRYLYYMQIINSRATGFVNMVLNIQPGVNPSSQVPDKNKFILYCASKPDFSSRMPVDNWSALDLF